MQDEEDVFLRTLSKDIQTEYLGEKAELVRKLEQECKVKYDELYKKKSKGISDDRAHRAILNGCIFPFSQKNLLSGLDYVYVKSSPLAEKGVKNMDFLIVSPSKRIAIFGDAKHSVDDPNKTIDQMKERIRIVEENRDCIENYAPNISTIEYVLAVDSFDATNMSKAILRTKSKIILWQVGGYDEEKLGLIVPPTDDRNERDSIMHSEEELSRALSEVRTSTEFKTFFLESHPVAKMELLTAIDKGSDDVTFALDDLKTLVKQELDNESDERIDTESKKIIALAMEIGFVRQQDDKRYKIQSRHKKSASRYEELKQKWIEYFIQVDKDEELSQEIAKLQKRMLDRQSAYTLDKFGNRTN